MAKQYGGKLNQLERSLPEGLIVDSAWLSQHNYSRSLLNQYVNAGWLEQPTRGVYRRPRGQPSWQQAVISLQTLLGANPVIVGGRTALELQGYAHYLALQLKEVHLYGVKRPPSWLFNMQLNINFVFHNSRVIFNTDLVGEANENIATVLESRGDVPSRNSNQGVITQVWGQWDWPIMLSAPERALLELLNELPNRESFHHVDMLFEGLANLSPRRLMALLSDCRNVKIKRLFFYFAARHDHAWFKRIDRTNIDLGSGKRMLVKGGRLDPATQITVPQDMNGIS